MEYGNPTPIQCLEYSSGCVMQEYDRLKSLRDKTLARAADINKQMDQCLTDREAFHQAIQRLKDSENSGPVTNNFYGATKVTH